MSPKPSYVFGWHSPRFAIWTVKVERLHPDPLLSNPFRNITPEEHALAILLGVLRWLLWCLPYIGIGKNSTGFRFLAFHLNIIRGPNACAYCGRATKSTTGEAGPCCSRKACLERDSEIAIERIDAARAARGAATP